MQVNASKWLVSKNEAYVRKFYRAVFTEIKFLARQNEYFFAKI